MFSKEINRTAERFAAGIRFSTGREPETVLEMRYRFEENAYKGDLKAVQEHIQRIKENQKLFEDFKTQEYPGRALFYAAESKHVEVMVALLNAGARTNVYVYNTLTFVFLCEHTGYEEVLAAYLEKAQVSDELFMRGFLASVYNNTPKVLGILLDKNPKLLNGQLKEDLRLMGAAAFGNQELVECLLKERADIHTQNQKGWTAIDFAFANPPKASIPSEEDCARRSRVQQALLMNLSAFVDQIKDNLHMLPQTVNNLVLEYYLYNATEKREKISNFEFVGNSEMVKENLQLFYFKHQTLKSDTGSQSITQPVEPDPKIDKKASEQKKSGL